MSFPPTSSSYEAFDDEPALEYVKDRERDRDRHDAVTSTRSYKIAWLGKVHASLASMEQFTTTDTPHLDADNQWRWHNIASILAEEYCSFDASLHSIFQGFKSTVWNFKGTCLLHQCTHQHNRWSLINTPGFPHTTKFRCFHGGEERLLTKLPF